MEDDDLAAIALEDARDRMDKSLEALAHDLETVRTGRAHPTLIEHLQVDCYGVVMGLNQIATISAPEPRLLMVQPWDKNTLAPITKAVQQSKLGLNPQQDGNLIRIPIPDLTEERRRELVRLVHSKTEAARVAVRNIRRDVQDDLRTLEKDKDISQDQEHRAHDTLDKVTHTYTEKVDAAGSAKERELLKV